MKLELMVDGFGMFVQISRGCMAFLGSVACSAVKNALSLGSSNRIRADVPNVFSAA
jgi:hypothetical protein